MQVMEKWEVGRLRMWGVINGGIQGLQYAIYGLYQHHPFSIRALARAQRRLDSRIPGGGGGS